MPAAATATVTVEIPFLPWWGKPSLRVEVGAEIDEGLRLKAALEIAVRDRASLDRARLDGASLVGASLVGAILDRASLDGARLDGARLVGANLDGASLDGANLDGANLAGAYLKNKEKLIGHRPIFQIGPIGSRCAYFVAYITDQGLRFEVVEGQDSHWLQTRTIGDYNVSNLLGVLGAMRALDVPLQAAVQACSICSVA